MQFADFISICNTNILASSLQGYHTIMYVTRVWVGPGDRDGGFKVGDQVGYLNVVPACLHPGGVTSNPQFDTIQTTVDKLNVLLKHRPIPGDHRIPQQEASDDILLNHYFSHAGFPVFYFHCTD